MSLPTRVAIFKDDVLVNRVFYNIGWVFNEFKLVSDMRDLIKSTDCDYVVVYGQRYDANTIDDELMWIEALAENYRFDMLKKCDTTKLN